jgi:hypothetical protein
MTEEFKRSWPFGKPSEAPDAYKGDRQTEEEAALRPLHACWSHLTPKGRIKQRVDKARFKENAGKALTMLTALKEKYPDGTLYDGWIAEAEKVVSKVK